MPGDRSPRTRRRFLRTAGSAATAGVAALAGCSDLGDSTAADADDVPDEKFSTPDLADEARQSLEEIGEIREVTDGPGLTAYTAGRIYEVTDVTERISDKTMGRLSEPLVTFFAAESNLEGWTTGAASPGRIADASKGIVEQRLRELGASDVREVDPSPPLPERSPSETVEFRGTYRTPAIEQSAELPNGQSFPIEIPAQDLPVAGVLTVWKPEAGTALLAGGGYPVEDYEATGEASVTGDLGDGIDVTVSVDLNLRPSELRTRLNELVDAVS